MSVCLFVCLSDCLSLPFLFSGVLLSLFPVLRHYVLLSVYPSFHISLSPSVSVSLYLCLFLSMSLSPTLIRNEELSCPRLILINDLIAINIITVWGSTPFFTGLIKGSVLSCEVWWLSGMVGALRPKGRRFESHSSRHLETLVKPFTHSCL